MATTTYDEMPNVEDYPIYSKQYLKDREEAQRRSEENTEKKQRIAVWMGIAMVCTAVGIDLILAILGFLGIGEFINWFIDPVVDFGFIIWFWLLGVNFFGNTKRVVMMSATAVVGLIPFLNILPELTLGIAGMVVTVWVEDNNKIIGKLKKIGDRFSTKKLS